MRIVSAVGGNALLHRGETPDAKTQVARLGVAAPALAALAGEHEVVIVHGNGPQVGLLAMENSDDTSLSAPYPLSDLVAENQGLIGFWFQRALGHAGLDKDVVVLVSRTLVDPSDPRLPVPTKFVGSLYDEPAAHALAQNHQWTDAADGSVILAGGGGVPVIPDGPGFRGIEGIVDKDYAAARAAADFVTASGGRAVIGSLDNLEAIMNGNDATEILGPARTQSRPGR
ncbi:amino acid kinase family protein [Arthrobacter sp. TMN-49]